MDHDHALTRVDVPKVHKSKAKDIGREIVLDQERCILCSRCIRFCDEVPGTSELGMMSRGDRERLDIAPGRRLDNDYSLNVVDICPVGALTSKDFRFKSRVWDLRTTPSTCSGCATGCATELHWRQEEADAVRLVPRHDPAVNSYWMCDEGRHTYHELAADQRVLRARVDGEDVPLAQAIAAVADRVRGKSHVAVVFSATATNETNLALARLATHLDAARFLHARPDGKGDQILRAADKNPNLAGASAAAGSVEKHAGELALELAGGAYEVVIFADTCGPLPELALRGLRDIVSIALADRSDVVSDACTIVLPATSWAESFGTYTNRQGRLRALFPAWRAEGERRARADLLRDLLVALGGTADFGGNDDLVRGLAAQHGHAVLTAALADRELARPTLMRWGHSRG
jgi:NADH-quinone oxidoreductase subunit G